MASNAKTDIATDIGTTFGQVNIGENTETQKTPIMSFSEGNVYLGLKLVSYFDQKTNTRKEPVPKITASFGGKFDEKGLIVRVGSDRSGRWVKKQFGRM